jgi:hypothetical protein
MRCFIIQSRSSAAKASLSAQAGVTIIEALVAAVVVAIAGFGVGAMLRYAMSVERDFNRLAQVEILRRTIRTEFNCRKSLNLDLRQPLPQAKACDVPPNRTMEILGAEGSELFPLHVSGEYYRVADWHVRARCQGHQIVFEARMNQRSDQRTSKADALFGTWRDLFSGTGRFCRQYLAPELSRCSGSPYSELAGFDSRGPVCCRHVVATGAGSASARCASYEVLFAGGTQCAGSLGGPQLAGVSISREVVKERLQGPAMGTTKQTRTTIAVPGVPHFFFPSADLIANIMSPFESARVRRGGFLAASFPKVNDNNVLSAWEGACRSDDSLNAFPTTAYALCCPKRW